MFLTGPCTWWVRFKMFTAIKNTNAVCRVQMLQVSAAWHEIGIVFLEIILVLDWIFYVVFFTLVKLCQKVLVFTSHSPVHTSIFFRCNGTSPAQEGISLSTSLTIFGGRFTNWTSTVASQFSVAKLKIKMCPVIRWADHFIGLQCAFPTCPSDCFMASQTDTG